MLLMSQSYALKTTCSLTEYFVVHIQDMYVLSNNIDKH